MGRGAQRAMVYMIDFGLSKYYCHPTNKRHISFVKGKKLTGTVRYASINAHHGCGEFVISSFCRLFVIDVILLRRTVSA